MTNIEQIYRRFVEERRRKLIRLIDDKWKWSRLDNGLLNVIWHNERFSTCQFLIGIL